MGPLSLNERAILQSVSVVTSKYNYLDRTVSAIVAAHQLLFRKLPSKNVNLKEACVQPRPQATVYRMNLTRKVAFWKWGKQKTIVS